MECEKSKEIVVITLNLSLNKTTIFNCVLNYCVIGSLCSEEKEEEQADCPADDAYNLGFMNNIYFSIPYPQEKLPMIKMK